MCAPGKECQKFYQSCTTFWLTSFVQSCSELDTLAKNLPFVILIALYISRYQSRAAVNNEQIAEQG